MTLSLDSLSLRIKATVVVWGIIILGLTINAVVMYLHTNQLIVSQQARAVTSMARSLGQASELALAVHDRAEMNRLVEGFLTNEDVLFAAIYEGDGTLQAHASKDHGLWQSFQEGRVMGPEFTIGDATVQLSGTEGENWSLSPTDEGSQIAYYSPQIIGRVLVALSTEPVLLAQRQAAAFRLATAMFIAIGSGLVIFFVVGTWNRRVGRLVQAAERIAGGDLTQSIESVRYDELGRLCQAFEEMRQAVQKRDQNLRQFNEGLQQEVAERTADLQKALVTAEVANESKSHFLANMSHEIRTPMTAILGYADLMVDPTQGPSDRLECIQTIRRNSSHLLSIINDILDISKIEAGKMMVERINCSPMEIVADVASLMRGRALEQELQFSIEYDGPVPTTIQSDPTRLRQILLNLCGNGIKFTKRGEVKVVVRLVKNSAPQHLPPSRGGDLSPATDDDESGVMQFDVIDTGIGLTPEQQSALFQPFTQADASTTRLFGGTGLGLTISRRLARMLGGDIAIESQAGRGSCFTLTIETGSLKGVKMLEPANESMVGDESDRVISCAPALNSVSLAGVHILLAEDGPDNQRLISFHLRKAGAKVTIADNGRIATEMAKAQGPFDVILMDMQMPEMDGYSATTYLRNKDYAGPIIALTAHAMQGDREKCIRAGCNDYATKPIDRDALIGVIKKWASAATIGL